MGMGVCCVFSDECLWGWVCAVYFVTRSLCGVRVCVCCVFSDDECQWGWVCAVYLETMSICVDGCVLCI